MGYVKTVWNPGGPPAVNAENLNKIEQGIYDAHVTADAAVKKSGDTMTGDLTIQGALRTRNAADAIYVGDDAIIEDFNTANAIRIKGQQNPAAGEIFVSTNNWKVWHSGNDGENSGLDADKVKGKNITVSSTAPSNPQVNDIWIQI